MKKIFATILAGAMLMFAAPALAGGFLSFDQQIKVGTDSVLTVQEKVTVNFSYERHGIYRDLPVKYTTESGNPFSLRVKVIAVTDDNGRAIDYTTSASGNDLSVKIGDADTTVTGRQVYVITYTVSRALLFLSDHDELYWNAIVGSWGDLGLPEEINETVILPDGALAASTRTACYTTIGSKSEAGCKKTITDKAAHFSASGTPLTVVVGWPKGLVVAPAPTREIKDWFADNWIIFWPFVVFAVMFMLWYKKGRDPKPDGAMVVQYDPPEGALPAEVGVLFDQKANVQEITATIVHLAVKGYLNIIEIKTKDSFIPKVTYTFELKKSLKDDGSLSGYEYELLHGIFGGGASAGAVVGLDSLKEQFYKTSNEAKKLMDAAVVKRGWFAKSPTAVRAGYMGAGIGYLMIAFWLLHPSGPVSFISALLPGAIIAFFGYFMPARTIAGTKAHSHALGFKEYLSKAETYRLKWEEKENIFQAFLPYAMVFDVVDKWAKAFEGMDLEPPSWYHGSSANLFTPILFAHALTNATSSIGQALTVAPSAKGGGGFGGGGFGGGGFGGGGGGSW